MRSIQVVKIAGIPIKIHWTFILFMLFLLGVSYYALQDQMFWFVGFVLAMFVCVILHEYGHALSARRYGVKTLDIIISPIGGLARLEELPEKPIQELIVAIAGPLVNVVISIFLLLTMFLFYQDFSFLSNDLEIETLLYWEGFFVWLIAANIALFVFNLAPAFPMDGGRILRALLSIKLGKVKGTQIASTIGQILAVIFMIYGLYRGVYIWIFLGGFVFIMARNENRQVILEGFLKNKTVRDIQKTDFTKVNLGETFKALIEIHQITKESTFLVFNPSENFDGFITNHILKKAIQNKNTALPVDQYVQNNAFYISSEETLYTLLKRMQKERAFLAYTKNGDQIQGVVDRHMLQNYIQKHLST